MRRIYWQSGGTRERGKLDREARALPEPGTLRVNAAAVQRHDVMHKSKPEAEATVPSAGDRLRLPEALEDVRQRGCFDPGAVVGHDESGLPVGSLERELDPAARTVELERVAEEVAHRLQHAVAIAFDEKRFLDPAAQIDLP